MKRTLTFLMTALFLCVGITVKAQTFPETSTAEAPKYYTIASFNRGGYLTNVGEGKSVEHVATTKGSIWYFTKADENGGLHFCNFEGGYLAADKTISETAGTWYVLANGVNTDGVSISSTNPISSGSCIDANNYNTGVGAWHPSASDWDGTTWVFAEVTDFSVIFNVDEAKANAKAELDVLASETAIYPDAASAKANIDAVQAEGTSAEQLLAAIDAVNQCVVDYKNAAYQALEGKYFTISTPGRNNLFMNLADERVKGVASVENTLSALWQFQCVDGTVRIFNPATEMYICEPQGSSEEVLVTASAADAGLYQLAINANAENSAAKVKFTSNGKSVHMAGHAVLVRWDDGGASEWTIAETVVDVTKDIAALLEANTENHAELPALGQYSTEGYNALLEAKNTVTTLKQAAAAIAAFEATKNLPLFTIDSQKDYAAGQSIYENEEGALKFKTTDAADKSMLWAFDMTATEVGLTDKVVVRNAATGNLFWGASFISVIETEPAVEGDGVFMFKTEGTGSPVHAQQNGSSIVRWSSADANTVGGASTWKFAFVGISNPAAYDLSEVATAFTEQAIAFAGLQENASLSALPAVQEKWAEAMGVVEPLFGKVSNNELVLKADVVAAMEMMAEIQAVVAYYGETFVAAKDEANAAMDELDEESEEFAALLGAINVSTVTTVTELEAKAEIIAEVLEYLASLPEVDPNDYTSYIINADLSTGDAWNTGGTKGISGGMVKVASESAFDFSQTITLPAGQYKMTAKAVYRYTGSEAEEFAAIEAGTKTRLVNLYAETATYKYEADVMNRYDGASDTDYAAGNGSVPVNGKFVPNSSSAVQAWFDNGQYVNELVFNVQEEGQVKIGLTRTGGISGDYTNIGAWTLTRLGDAEADPEVEEPTPDPDPTPDPEEPEETVDLDMTHKVSRDWEGKSGNVTIDGIAMSEKYEGNADPVGDQLWQTVTGLENGKYTVKLWANARVAWVGSPAADGQEELTYIFANNVEKSIAVLLNPHTNGNVLRTLEGVEVTDGTLRMGMKKVAPGSNWHSIQIESLTLHATNEVIANIAKVDLKAALDAANAVSPITDEFAAAIAAAQNVYDNSTDAEEVKAAVTSLKEATKLAILMNATEENPVLTDFVVNGTFDAGTTGWQTTTGAQNQQTNTNQQGAFTGNFFENWNPSAVTGKIYQVIENVPNGIYDLSICAFVNTFDASAQFVYANADKVALTAGEPTAYTVRTIVENNTIEVGFEQTVAVANWFGIDNVSLTYLGEASNEALVNAAKEAFTAAYAEFGVAMEACQAMMLKMSFYEIDDAAYQLNEQLETTTDVDALNSMAETLAEATASLKEINEVYAGYDVFVQKFKAAAEISEPTTTEAAELLEFNMYGGAGMQATSLEALAQAVETIKADYFTYIANAKLLDGNMFDLTFMIANAAVASKDAWTNGNTAGGESYAGAPDGQYLDWCNWSGAPATFNMSQEITGLPAGMYTLKAATRSDSRMVATIYAGTFEAAIHNVGNQGNELGGGWGWTVLENIEVSEEGTLTIGFTGTAQENGVWAGADNFQLYYGGPATDDVVLEIAKEAFTAAYAEFGVALEACQAMMLKMSFYEIDDAAYQLNEQLETTTDIDALNAMVESLAEATASLKEINEVYAGYDVFVQKFKAAAEISEPTTTEAAELLEFNMYGGAGMQATSLEALAQAVETIKADYFTYIANANLLDGNVFDLTYLLQNPNFDKNMDGWTCVNAGHNGGAGYNNVGGIAEIALWGNESWEASITQTLNELPNGKYIVKAAWMAASGIEMTFSANEGEASVTGIGDTGGNIDNDGNVVEMGQGFRGWQYVEVEGEVVDGTLTITVNSSSTALHTWSNADAFELYYAGVPAPEYLTVVGAKVGDVAIEEGAATVESISSFDITFDRPVALAEDAEWATLTDNWGDNSLKAEVLEDNNCVVRFSLQWEQVFTDAGDFYLYVPEGVVVDAENADIANTAIEAVITIEAAPVTPLAVTNVTVGEDVMEGFTVVATTQDMIKVNFDGEFYFQGMPSIVDAEGNDASEFFMFANGLDVDGSNSYIFRGMNAGTYTITMPKASFMNMMQWKAPAEDIVLTVEITFPDGIQNIEVDADAVIYDLSGRRVNVMTKGIYIVNGKKVIKK